MSGTDQPGWDNPMNEPVTGDGVSGADGQPDPLRLTRRLARTAELVHSVNYYTGEINGFGDNGFKGWWHAYMAYRSAPMGSVGAMPVVAAFYNFAPRMVERAVPGVWDIMDPDAVIARREELVGQAMGRIFADGAHDDVIGEAAELAVQAVADLDPGARPLSAANAELPWPDGSPALTVWHACTIWREYRGDSHNIALAGAGLDGVECHLLMAAAGHGNQPTLAGIRGWTEEEWNAAHGRLRDRGLLAEDGSYTDEGARFRAELENTTDRLSSGPVDALGVEAGARLYELLSTVGNHLKATGEVPGAWPPPAVQKG